MKISRTLDNLNISSGGNNHDIIYCFHCQRSTLTGVCTICLMGSQESYKEVMNLKWKSRTDKEANEIWEIYTAGSEQSKNE